MDLYYFLLSEAVQCGPRFSYYSLRPEANHGSLKTLIMAHSRHTIRLKTGLRIYQANSGLGLKVPKREIFHRSDLPDFYTIKSSWVGDLMVKILTYYFTF
jgi:hypothetical protein